MKKSSKWLLATLALLSLNLFVSSNKTNTFTPSIVYAENFAPVIAEDGTLSFTGQKQVLLGELDSLKRATSAHIQLQDKDEPKKQQEPKIKYDPVGWHNFKFAYNDGKKKAWLMHRGHLIGYQFSGLTNEKRNLAPMTAWLNAGNFKGTDEKNQESMLYYENQLDNWLAIHPNYWLDYKVTPIYTDKELLPRQIKLQYVGLDEHGQKLEIKVGGKETVDEHGITTVILDNLSPNATIDYATGKASPIDMAKKAEEEKKAAEQRQLEETQKSEEQIVPPEQNLPEAAPQEANQQEERTVYIARYGAADVYWYDTGNMPKNTRLDRVISMTESEAIAQGKRHTSKE
ncbi:DNA/RNA non-specific endonuclease [Streptococcus pneumoniae]